MPCDHAKRATEPPFENSASFYTSVPLRLRAQHLAPDDVPYYNAKRATEGLRERLWPYMTEGKLSVKLLVNHITKWQVRRSWRTGQAERGAAGQPHHQVAGAVPAGCVCRMCVPEECVLGGTGQSVVNHFTVVMGGAAQV
eukprot:1145348-Pelagomonas_calceolata.AAC.3